MLIPKWALRMFLKLRKFMLDFLSAVLSKHVLKYGQSPCTGPWVSVFVSAWAQGGCQIPQGDSLLRWASSGFSLPWSVGIAHSVCISRVMGLERTLQ